MPVALNNTNQIGYQYPPKIKSTLDERDAFAGNALGTLSELSLAETFEPLFFTAVAPLRYFGNTNIRAF